MRSALWLLALVALAAADPWEEPWVEEEDLEEPYSEEREENPRDAAVEPPAPRARRHAAERRPQHHHDNVRVERLRCHEAPYRVRRDSRHYRLPRHIHQYEVHEFTEEPAPSPAVPYEEMLAASTEHRQRTYVVPGPPSPAHYMNLNPDVSGAPFSNTPVLSITNFSPVQPQPGPVARPMAFEPPSMQLVSASSNFAPMVMKNARPFYPVNQQAPQQSSVNYGAPRAKLLSQPESFSPYKPNTQQQNQVSYAEPPVKPFDNAGPPHSSIRQGPPYQGPLAQSLTPLRSIYMGPPQNSFNPPQQRLVSYEQTPPNGLPQPGPNSPNKSVLPIQGPNNFVAPSNSPVSNAEPSLPVPNPQVNVATNHNVYQAYAPVQLTSANVPRSPSYKVAPANQIKSDKSHEDYSAEGLSIPADGAGPEPGPAPVASAKLAVGDLLGAPGGHVQHHHHHKKHGHGHSAGGGHSKHAVHRTAHGGKTVKGSHAHQHIDKGSKGHKTDEHHKKQHEEAAGHKSKHRDHAEHKGGHEEEAHGHRGAHFGEKKGHKKGHKTKGYHNKYHKDEFHKEHKFYDDFHKSGEHHRYGKFHAKHASDESGKKKAHHVNAGHDFVERGKKGYSNKGHLDADHKGHKAKHGHEEHHESHKNHGKKGGSEGGKDWAYAKKN